MKTDRYMPGLLRLPSKELLILFLIILTSSCHFGEQKTEDSFKSKDFNNLYYPSNDLDDLFKDVQLSGIFHDSKIFPDCEPVLPPDSIVKLYNQKKNEAGFDLRSFIESFFHCPVIKETEEKFSIQEDISFHLNTLWDTLTKADTGYRVDYSSYIPLPFPYVVPGGRFREMYYWDSYFTMEGLAASGRMDLVENMLDNFVSLIKEFGYIPNGNRTYFLSRSQPPFFAEMIKLLMREKNDSAGEKYLPPLLKEYRFWMDSNGDNLYRRTVKVGDLTLNRYWDEKTEPRPEAFKQDYLLAQELNTEEQAELYRNIRAACESGWDFSSRWLSSQQNLKSIQTTNILPIDLNCLLFNMEMVISQLYQIKSFDDSAIYYADIAEKRKCMIQEIFWSQESGFFFDYHITDRKLMEVYTLAGVFPLYFGIATEDQAEKVMDQLHAKFRCDGGLVTTLNQTGEQWDAPNGWAPLQWISIIGLENYGYHGLASVLAQRWLNLNRKVYRQTGKMMEKYNVTDPELPGGGGEYPLQDGFGWTNGVYLGLIEKGYSPEK